MKKSDHDETKLPVWARDLLISLRNQNRVLTEALDIAKLQAPTRRATGKVMVLGPPDVALLDRARVRFTCGSGGRIELHLDGNGQLCVYAEPSVLYVLPRASNSIYLTTEKAINARFHSRAGAKSPARGRVAYAGA